MAKGFKPVNHQLGADWNVKTERFHVDSAHSTALAVGDLVVLTGTAHTDGVAEVDAASAGGLITGVIAAIEVNTSDLETTALAASTAGYVHVITDPYVVYEAEISGGTIAVTDVGSNADIVATAASASGNLTSSNMTVDASAFGSSTAQIRIIGLTLDANGDVATAAGSTVLCRINESTEKGVVGV